jgi:hypothetical protein
MDHFGDQQLLHARQAAFLGLGEPVEDRPFMGYVLVDYPGG